MRELPIIERPPMAMCNEIGRIVVHYAMYEYILLRLAYLLLGLNPKQGRVAVREPRGSDLVEMVRDLIHIAGLTVPYDFASLIAETKKQNSERDRLAHGVWLRDRDQNHHFLLLTRGTWRPRGQKQSRKLSPEGLHYELEHLKDVTKNVRSLVTRANQLHKLIVAAQRHTSKHHGRDHSSRHQSGSKSQRQS